LERKIGARIAARTKNEMQRKQGIKGDLPGVVAGKFMGVSREPKSLLDLKGDADLTPILPFAFRSTASMTDKL
jgi:hypothetical protein